MLGIGIALGFDANSYVAEIAHVELDEETGEIVGIHVIPMMLGAIPNQPDWSVLVWAVMAGDYGTELLRERLPLFIDEVAEAFRLYWKPAPPIEEQLAALQRGSRERRSA